MAVVVLVLCSAFAWWVDDCFEFALVLTHGGECVGHLHCCCPCVGGGLSGAYLADEVACVVELVVYVAA